MGFFVLFLRISEPFPGLFIPDARKSSEVRLELKPEGVMDQVNFRADGVASPSRLLELMS